MRGTPGLLSFFFLSLLVLVAEQAETTHHQCDISLRFESPDCRSVAVTVNGQATDSTVQAVQGDTITLTLTLLVENREHHDHLAVIDVDAAPSQPGPFAFGRRDNLAGPSDMIIVDVLPTEVESPAYLPRSDGGASDHGCDHECAADREGAYVAHSDGQARTALRDSVNVPQSEAGPSDVREGAYVAHSDAELHADSHARTALHGGAPVPSDNDLTRTAVRDMPPSQVGRTRTAAPNSVNCASVRESTGYASVEAQLMANCRVIRVPDDDDDDWIPDYLRAENYEEQVDAPPPMFLGRAPPHFQEAPLAVTQGTDIHNLERAVQRLLRWLTAAGSRFSGQRG